MGLGAAAGRRVRVNAKGLGLELRGPVYVDDYMAWRMTISGSTGARSSWLAQTQRHYSVWRIERALHCVSVYGVM